MTTDLLPVGYVLDADLAKLAKRKVAYATIYRCKQHDDAGFGDPYPQAALTSHAAAQSRINALLEEVEAKNQALAMALGLLADTRYKALLTEKLTDWIMSNLPIEERQFSQVIDAAIDRSLGEGGG